MVAAPVAAQSPEPHPSEAAAGFDVGAADAPVTVVEFADFACSACALFAAETWPALKERYVESGRVRWRIIPFQLGFRNSEEGARAARCAARQVSFATVHDALFARRDEWVDERNPEAALRRLADAIGVDGPRFEACYESDAVDEAMETANEAAEHRGVRGTPTFFVDGVPLQGAVPLDAFVQILDRALAAGSGR